MRIEVKGRNLPVSEDLREHVTKRFRKVERQVSELAELEVEVFEERNPAIADNQVAEVTLHLKGVTLRAREASPDICTRSTCARTSSTFRSSATATSAASGARRGRPRPRARRPARARSTDEALLGGVDGSWSARGLLSRITAQGPLLR